MVTFFGFLAGQLGSSGFSDALLPLKPDFRLNPNDLTRGLFFLLFFFISNDPLAMGAGAAARGLSQPPLWAGFIISPTLSFEGPE